MLGFENRIKVIRERFQDQSNPTLSIYCDVNPAKPENTNRAWITRIKTTLRELSNSQPADKNLISLCDEVVKLLETDRPSARTLVLFASKANLDLMLERLDLQIELPVVDLASGHIEVHYGKPYLNPLLFAIDEYERTGILHLAGKGWKFFEVFLGEIREEEQVFSEIDDKEWQELHGAAQKVNEMFEKRGARPGGLYDEMSPKERASSRIDTLLHKQYKRLSYLLDKAVDSLAIERIVLMGEKWQVNHFENYMSRGSRNRIVARIPRPANSTALTRKDFEEYIFPVLEKVEREAEMELLEQVKQKGGLWGMASVLDALQYARVNLWILPWSLREQAWYCKEQKFIAATEEMAKIVCKQPERVALRNYVWELAAEFGARLEFVRGDAEEKLIKEMGGMAALLRW
ncbi:MAG: VLRF1 family aeRF1-type release factor [Pyrinomonadaceae bacterium]|nr:VLRF1 family aeRF1-type release factor [Pyrinomonadaceae bacterium]MCX7639342.1 VLRF1 family aeRF1-type release factor [Pyrinomonadaceae bacterium]MDW8305242.1 VLRF1 family aeRF1-type release factor [Acidobacteriota bacterium]